MGAYREASGRWDVVGCGGVWCSVHWCQGGQGRRLAPHTSSPPLPQLYPLHPPPPPVPASPPGLGCCAGRLINTGTRRYLDAYEGVFLKAATLMALVYTRRTCSARRGVG